MQRNKKRKEGAAIEPNLVSPALDISIFTFLGSARLGSAPSLLFSCTPVPDSRTVAADCRNSLEAEPWRCKRTDGKSWRCTKYRVPDKKYCEKHMYRGKKPRKQVEQGTSSINMANSSPNISNSMPSQLVTSNAKKNRSSHNKRNASPRLGSSPKSAVESDTKSAVESDTCERESLFVL